jgi:hypothetical protein
MFERPSFNSCREGLLSLVALGLTGASTIAGASDLCDLKYQADARGQWAVQRKSADYFVFRTQRKLLEPPVIDGVAAYFDVAEDAALDSLTAYLAQQPSAGGKSGKLVLGQTLQPQRIRCAEIAWTVFAYDLTKVTWTRLDVAPASKPALVPAPPTPPTPATAVVPVAPAPAPAAITAAPTLPSASAQAVPARVASPAPAKARASNLKTYEE